MYGTVSGLIPRALRVGKPAPIVLGVALLGFAIYRYGPDLYAGWLSIGAVGPSLTSSRPTPAEPTPAPRPVKSAASKASTQRQPNSSWKAIVLNNSVPAMAEPAPLVGKSIEDADAKSAAESSAPTEHADTTPPAASTVIQTRWSLKNSIPTSLHSVADRVVGLAVAVGPMSPAASKAARSSSITASAAALAGNSLAIWERMMASFSSSRTRPLALDIPASLPPEFERPAGGWMPFTRFKRPG